MSDDHRDNPWRAVASRPVYENPWIRVRQDDVIRPDGLPGIYGVVEFKNRAVGVLPVEDDGSVWLVGQHRYPLDAYSWEIPEGGCPAGESTEDAARRELKEETGMTCDRLELVARCHLSNSVSDEEAFIYRATGLTHGPSEPEGSERLEVRRVAWPEARRMVMEGGITDAMSVVAMLREAIRRLEGDEA